MPHYHHGNLEEALIQSGCDELDLVGPQNLSLRQIAKKAGVSHNAPYRHFPDKDALILAICEKTARGLAEQIESAPMIYPASALLQGQYIGRLFADLALKHPRRAQLLFGATSEGNALTKTHRHQIQNLSQATQSVFEQAETAGLLDACPPTLGLTFLSALRGITLWIAADVDRLGHHDETFDLVDEIAQNILLGVLPVS